jgi:hypothetical protein
MILVKWVAMMRRESRITAGFQRSVMASTHAVDCIEVPQSQAVVETVRRAIGSDDRWVGDYASDDRNR